MSNTFGIDVETRDAKKLIHALKRLKTTYEISGPFMYHEDKNYSQVHISTIFTESELDDWLWRVNHGAEYIGVYLHTNKI